MDTPIDDMEELDLDALGLEAACIPLPVLEPGDAEDPDLLPQEAWPGEDGHDFFSVVTRLD